MTIRHLSVPVLLGIALFPKGEASKTSKAKFWYFLYLALYIVANVVNREYTTHSFVQSLLTYHAPSIGVILALPVILRGKNNLEYFTKSLIILYCINAAFTALEYVNYKPAWEIARLISSSTEEGIYKADMYTDDAGSLWGYSIIGGIMGSVVQNGYFSATFLPVVSYRLLKHKGKDTLVGLLMFMVGVLVISITQQRMAFVSLVIYAIFLFFLVAKIENKVFLIFLAIFLSIYAISLEHINWGRLAGSANITSRFLLFDRFFEFINTKAFWYGGAVKFLETYEKAQHNTFLAAWVLGGVFTFIVFCVLYFKLLRDCIVRISENIKRSYSHPYTICYAVAAIIFMIYSLTHSAGIQSGSPMFWIAFTAMIVAVNKETSDESS